MKKDVAQLVLGAMKQIVEGNVMQSLGKSEWTIQEALVQYQSIAAKAYADLAADIAQPVEPIGHIVCGDLVQVDDGVEQADWSVDLDHGPIEKLSAANPGERIAIYAAPQEAAAPAGWKLVPIEPTADMLKAGVIEQNGAATYRCISNAGVSAAEGDQYANYKAMIEAAPGSTT